MNYKELENNLFNELNSDTYLALRELVKDLENGEVKKLELHSIFDLVVCASCGNIELAENINTDLDNRLLCEDCYGDLEK